MIAITLFVGGDPASIEPQATPQSVGEAQSAADSENSSTAACIFCLGVFGSIALLAIYPIALFNRLAVALPSIALGRGYSYSSAWKATRRNTWRVTLLFVAAMMPTTIIVAIAMAYHFEPANMWIAMAYAGSCAIIFNLTGLVLVAAISFAHRHFILTGR